MTNINRNFVPTQQLLGGSFHDAQNAPVSTMRPSHSWPTSRVVEAAEKTEIRYAGLGFSQLDKRTPGGPEVLAL